MLFKKGSIPWNKGKHIKSNNALVEWKTNGGVSWPKGKKRPDQSGENHPLFGTHLSDEHKKKLVDSRKGKLGPRLGIKLSDELKQKMSLSHKGKNIGELNHFYGKKHSEESKQKISKFQTGKKVSIETRIKLSKSSHKGIDNWKWKGGITPFNRLERIRFQHSMQKQVFERDNYTCQMCGKRGVDLQVDHIQPWKDFIELRFSMDNCRTLCAKCHYKITFGKEMPIEIKSWGHNNLKGVLQ